MNTVATRTLAEMARKAGVKRYLFASSCSIYDVGIVDEERDVLLNEESAVQPRAAYAVSKLAGERGINGVAWLLTLPPSSSCVWAPLFGFSPPHAVRNDLVVNTFVKDAFLKGESSPSILGARCGVRWWTCAMPPAPM